MPRGSHTITASAEHFIDERFETKMLRSGLLPPGTSEVLARLRAVGYTVIVVHPERYRYWHQRPECWQDLIGQGCKHQLNVLSLVGGYGPVTEDRALGVLRLGIFAYAGSDCHRVAYVEALWGLVAKPKAMELCGPAGCGMRDGGREGAGLYGRLRLSRPLLRDATIRDGAAIARRLQGAFAPYDLAVGPTALGGRHTYVFGLGWARVGAGRVGLDSGEGGGGRGSAGRADLYRVVKVYPTLDGYSGQDICPTQHAQTVQSTALGRPKCKCVRLA